MLSGTLFASEKKEASPRHYRIFMVLWSGEDPLSKGFMDYLRRKGVPVEYIIRNCDQDRKRCHALVPEIRAAKPDLIFTWGTPVCEEIGGRIDAADKENYIWDIPIVSLIVTDPIRSKVIYDLAQTGRNITGVNHVAPVSSHIEAMKSYLRNLKKVATLYNPTETNSRIMITEFGELGPQYGLEVRHYPVPLDSAGKPIPESLPEIIKKISEDGNEFIYMPADTFLSVNMEVVSSTSIQYKLPTFGSTESMFFKSHPLMGLLSRFYDVGLLGGLKAEQILVQKKSPTEIPYEKLKTFSLLLSPDVYQKIKIYPPLTILKIAELIHPSGTKNIDKNSEIKSQNSERTIWDLF